MRRLIDLGLPVEHPREIESSLNKLKSTYDEKVVQLFVDVGNETADMEKHLAAYRESASEQIEARTNATHVTIEALAGR